MITVADGIAWPAAPHSIAFGGYGVVFARELDSEELVTRLTATVFGSTRTTRLRLWGPQGRGNQNGRKA